MQRTLAALRATPGVDGVTVTQTPPFGPSRELERFSGSGRRLERGELAPIAFEVFVERTDADFPMVAGLRLLEGRTFTAAEVSSEASVAVVSASVARRFFRDGRAVGQPLSVVPSRRDIDQDAVVVGVVADALMSRPSGQQQGTIYRPIQRSRVPASSGSSNPPSVLIRSSQPALTARAVAASLRQVDPRIRPVTTTVQAGHSRFLAGRRMLASLAAPLAGLALVLAVLGAFGVTAFVVSQRAHEVSLRLAIGASSFQVLTLLIRDGLRPAALGMAVGLSAALAVSYVFASEVAGVSPYDPLSIAGACALMAGSVVIAVAIPARRIAAASPATLLRHP
jgi:putative ABC transport system permease protein